MTGFCTDYSHCQWLDFVVGQFCILELNWVFLVIIIWGKLSWGLSVQKFYMDECLENWLPVEV